VHQRLELLQDRCVEQTRLGFRPPRDGWLNIPDVTNALVRRLHLCGNRRANEGVRLQHGLRHDPAPRRLGGGSPRPSRSAGCLRGLGRLRSSKVREGERNSRVVANSGAERVKQTAIDSANPISFGGSRNCLCCL